jgi:hypothetical protein
MAGAAGHPAPYCSPRLRPASTLPRRLPSPRLPRPSSPEGCQRRPCLNPARPSQDSAAGEGSGPVIGKSKEQVEDALKAANAAKKDEL